MLGLIALSLPSLVTVAAAAAAAVASDPNCAVQPFPLQYTYVTVLDTPPVIESPHKALGLIFGGAKKLLSMGFGTTANSTFVPDFDHLCNASDPTVRSCIFWRGGVFSPEKSDTWQKDGGVQPYNGSVSNEGWDYLNSENYKERGDDPIASFPRGWDTVDLGSASLYSFPFSVIDNSSFPFGTGMVGLASDSIFLRSVVQAKLAPSRTWGFDYGQTGDQKDSLGELVIGGYNPNKASYQDFTNYTISDNNSVPCPLQVEVEGIRWGGVDLMDGQAKFMACVEPAYWSLILPLRVQKNWNASLIGHKYSWWKSTWEYMYMNKTNAAKDFPADDLEFTLSKGFKVSIPRGELFGGAVVINSTRGGFDPIEGQDGQQVIQVNSGTAGSSTGTEPKMPSLGAPFLSQVYVAVDYENGVFSLAKTKRGQSQVLPLRTLGCSAQGASAATSPSKNTGRIVGGAVGGALGAVVAVAGLLYFFYFRKRNPAEPVPPGATQQASYDNKPAMSDYNSLSSPYGTYTSSPGSPPPPETVAGSMGSPYAYQYNTPDPTGGSASTGQWAKPSVLPPQQLAATATERGERAELGAGSPVAATFAERSTKGDAHDSVL